MNVGKLVEWGVKTLALLDAPARLVPLGITEERMREKLSWLEGYREALGEWSGYQEVIDGTLDFVRRRGLYAGAEIDLAAAVPARSGPAGELRAELMEFVRGEGLKARPGERLPGTTEVVESCFGKLKALEDGQSKGGFTGLVLSLGAMVSDWTAERVSEALAAMSGPRCPGLVPQDVGAVGTIAKATRVRRAGWRNKTGMNATSRQPRLFTAPERYYVHYVGTDMSDNEWVTSERVRFPASPEGHCGAPWDWSFPAGAFGAGDWCGKGGRSKPAPVDQEI